MQRLLIVCFAVATLMSSVNADPQRAATPMFKGYELYSYRTGDDWHYVLMPGTNRTKSLNEIASARSMTLSEFKASMGKMAVGEYVFWFHRTSADKHHALHLEYPSQAVIDDLQQTAKQDQVNLDLPAAH